jgi:hypothetical protein
MCLKAPELSTYYENPLAHIPAVMLLSHFEIPAVAWALLVVLVGYAAVSRIGTWLRLRHIPGPSFAGLSKFWLLRKALGGRFHLDTAEACEKYGQYLSMR